MNLKLDNVRVHKAKKSKNYLNVMVLSNDDDLSFIVPLLVEDGLENKMVNTFEQNKGKNVNMIIDLLPKKDGFYFNVVSVSANGKA